MKDMKQAEIITELDELINRAEEVKSQYGRHQTLFSKWENDVVSLVSNVLKDSENKISIFKGVNYKFYGFVSENSYRNAFCRGVNEAVGILQSWKTEVEKFWVDNEVKVDEIKRDFTYSCFIVHGHNNEVKLEVKDFIEDLEHEIDCTILHKKANKGKTIVEKFESHSEVDFAVCLWTCDDTGKANVQHDYSARARQNVVLETGYFLGQIW